VCAGEREKEGLHSKKDQVNLGPGQRKESGKQLKGRKSGIKRENREMARLDEEKAQSKNKAQVEGTKRRQGPPTE